MKTDYNAGYPKNLMIAVRRFNRLAMPKAGIFSTMDMKPGEIFLMMHLGKAKDGDGLKPSELAESLSVSAGNVTQLITSLEARGFVKRSHDALDRRVIRICITDEGAKAIQEAHDAMAQKFAGLIEHVGLAECEKLTVLLDRASDYFSSQNGSDPREGSGLC